MLKYKRKYLTIALILVALVIMNALAVQSAIDISVIGYAVGGRKTLKDNI